MHLHVFRFNFFEHGFWHFLRLSWAIAIYLLGYCLSNFPRCEARIFFEIILKWCLPELIAKMKGSLFGIFDMGCTLGLHSDVRLVRLFQPRVYFKGHTI